MGFFDRFKRGRLRPNRSEAFSDGVFAIIVTPLFFIVPVTRRDVAEAGAA